MSNHDWFLGSLMMHQMRCKDDNKWWVDKDLEGGSQVSVQEMLGK
jgi:hypothetical protein